MNINISGPNLRNRHHDSYVERKLSHWLKLAKGNRAQFALISLMCVLLVRAIRQPKSENDGALVGQGSGALGSNNNDLMGVHRKFLRSNKVGGTIEQKSFPASGLRNLIIVACHSVYTGVDFRHPEDQSSWFLLDYQRIPGQTESFLKHIELGVQEASKDESAMLLFSGGQTRRDAGPRAESMGYWMVAEANEWFGTGKSVRERAFTEEHSRDSLENFLFSLCRFYELTGKYPAHVVIVSYDFKKERFETLHRQALGWPESRLSFVGTPALTSEAIEGEEKTRQAFKEDPYGCMGSLAQKRQFRDPFAHGGYPSERCPDIGPLLQHCSTSHFSAPKLPWNKG
eukprot:jgi/Picsp_1/970/NSC_04454-R1_hypothetical protein CHLNCDRAFT_28621 [Chlorella variabilis]